MSKKIMSHELAQKMLGEPNLVVMVNGDPNACETEELTDETLEFGSKDNGDHAGGVTHATSWIKLGK